MALGGFGAMVWRFFFGGVWSARGLAFGIFLKGCERSGPGGFCRCLFEAPVLELGPFGFSGETPSHPGSCVEAEWEP